MSDQEFVEQMLAKAGVPKSTTFGDMKKAGAVEVGERFLDKDKDKEVPEADLEPNHMYIVEKRLRWPCGRETKGFLIMKTGPAPGEPPEFDSREEALDQLKGQFEDEGLTDITPLHEGGAHVGYEARNPRTGKKVRGRVKAQTATGQWLPLQ